MIDLDKPTYSDGDANSSLQYRFVGMSTDTWPTTRTTSTPLTIGCKLFLFDTGHTWFWNGTTWQRQVDDHDALLALSAAMEHIVTLHRQLLAELLSLRLGMIGVGTCEDVNQLDLEPILTAMTP